MQPLACLFSTIGGIALLGLAGPATADVVETRELAETVAVSGGEPLVVIVKNVFGSVRVIGHDADRVEMRATETIRGDLRADIERARAGMQLRTESEPGRVAFRVREADEPSEGCNCRSGFDGYTVEYDIELHVPRSAALNVATVNDGALIVENVIGDFELSNVNGAVRMIGAGGAGTVNTVNGDVYALFARAPSEPTSFRTVNGKLDVTFPANLSAELEFHTMHGDVFTDFDVETLTAPAQAQRARGRFFVNRSSAFRVAAGGDRHSFNTMNGDIFVRKANQ